MIVRLIILSFCVLFAFIVQGQIVTSAPSGTVISSSSAAANACGLSGGQTYSHFNTSWPDTYTPCYSFGVNDTLFSAINGNNTATGSCTGMANLVYSPGLSNLAAGIIVYTGTTSYKYLNTGNTYTTNTSVPVRAIITFSQAVTYYTNNTFVFPVTGNFTYQVIYECLSPTDAQYSSGTGNQWTPAVDLFNMMQTDPASSVCISFDEGLYYLSTVQANTGSTGTYCSGTTINLTGGGSGNNVTYSWSGPNTFYASGANAQITSATITNAGTYTFTATNDLGCKDTAHFQLNIDQLPIATAGGTAVICQNSQATVTGANAQNGTFSWTHNGNGSLSNWNTLTPTYTPAPSDAGNTVILTLHVTSNNNCTPAIATATYNIIVEGTPVATDGITSSACSTSSIPVTSATTGFGTINWTHNGTGTLTNATSSTPTYTPGPGDDGTTVILTLTVTSNNSCAPASATAYHFIAITPLPQAVAGGTATICENGSVTVTGASSQYGTVSWTHNGSGTLTNTTSLSPTYSPAPADVGGIVTLTMTVTSNNACAPATTTADFSVHVEGLPVAVSGDSTTVCSNGNALVNGALAQYGSISWTHNGNGSLVNSTSVNPTYLPTALDAGNTVILTMTVISNNSCAVSSSTANYYVLVDHLPVATCSGNTTICENASYQVSTAGSNYGTINWTHNGTGTISNSTTVNPSYNAAAADAGNVVTLTMTVTSDNTCAPQSASALFNITVQPLPKAIAGGTTTVCMTSNAPVSGVTATNGSIVWTHNGLGNLTNSTSVGPVYHPAQGDAGDTITLTLTVISNNTCAPQSAVANYTIIIDSLPLAYAGGFGSACENGTGTVSNAFLENGTPSWTANGGGILTNVNSLNPVYIPGPNEAGSDIILTLTVHSNNSCAPNYDQDQFILHIDSLPYASTLQFDTICPGGNYAIPGAFAANGVISWTHNGNGNLQNSQAINPIYHGNAADAGSTITFTLTVTSENSCYPQTATSSFQVYVENSSNNPVIILDSLKNVSCSGAFDGSVFVSVENGSPPFTYQWLPMNNNAEDITNFGPGTYTLKLMDSHGCTDLQSFTITEPPPLQITGSTLPANCSGTFGRINLEVTGGTPKYQYHWLPTNDTLPGLNQAAGGTYDVIVTDANGCTESHSFTVGIIGSLNVVATPDFQSVNIGTPVSILVSGADYYNWSPSVYLNCDSCFNVICTPYTSQTYIVTGYTPNGCTGQDTVTIEMYIDCGNLSIPSMFSPNNEGPAENNTFGLLGTYPCIEQYQLMIFNRWGEQVFETIDYKVQWDGTFQGKPVNTGVYVYRMSIHTIEGHEIKKSGNVTLVR